MAALLSAGAVEQTGTFTLSKGADVASANSLVLGSDGNYFDITGVTAITSIGTLGIGTVVTLHFDGILTLTHHATDLILPGGANITTAAGDEATFIEYASGDWRCVNYSTADGIAVNTEISEDTTPVLGGDLDAGSNQIQGAIINNLNAIDLGERILALMTDPRFLNVKCEDPGAGTMTDISSKGHDGTYTGTWASADRIKRGRTWKLNLNGTDAYIDLGDHDDFSFGDSLNDSPFTLFGLIEVVATVDQQRIITKRDSTNLAELREYAGYLNTLEELETILYDESANATESKTTDAALSVGWHSYASAYSGVGGVGAANGITHMIDGVTVASTRGVVGVYVAMENLACKAFIGAIIGVGGTPVDFFQGDMGIQGIDAVEWDEMDAWRFHQLCLAFYSEDGETL